MENLNLKNIILGSKSPRRKELLSSLGVEFSTEIKEVELISGILTYSRDEGFPGNEIHIRRKEWPAIR